MAPVLAVVREALLDAWALVQPVECLGCGAPDRAICAACRAQLVPGRARRVRCDADPGVPVWSAADYAGAIRGAVLALKDDARTDALRPLARCLRPAIGASLGGLAPGVELAAVPTTANALRRRGHDPVLGVVRQAGLPNSVVLRARRAVPQKSLGRSGRLANAGSRFAARGRLDGRRFLLVDDVVTTGATLAACAAAIQAAGGEAVAAAAICAPGLEGRASRDVP